MTDAGVRRSAPTTLPSVAVPTGVQPSGDAPQAGRAPARPSRRRLSARYALRGLVVAGIAGGTWLLWSAGASAAPVDAAGGSGVSGGITELLADTGSLSEAGLRGTTSQAVTLGESVLGTVVTPASTVPLASLTP